jgi:hypothetical protein
MGGWHDLRAAGIAVAQTRAAQAALSLTAHILILGGLLVANPWKQPPAEPDPLLIVDIVSLVPEEEEAPETPVPAAPPPGPPRRSEPALKPAPAPKPAPEPDPGVTMELPDLPEPSGEAPDEEAADGTGDDPPAVDPAVGQAIAALICRRMTDDERTTAGCAEQPRVDPFDRPPAIAMLTPEEQRIQAIRTGQIANTAGYDNFLEWYLERDKPIPDSFLDGVDNSIFLDRKDAATADHDRLMRGGTMDWERDIAKAHGRE